MLLAVSLGRHFAVHIPQVLGQCCRRFESAARNAADHIVRNAIARFVVRIVLGGLTLLGRSVLVRKFGHELLNITPAGQRAAVS